VPIGIGILIANIQELLKGKFPFPSCPFTLENGSWFLLWRKKGEGRIIG